MIFEKNTIQLLNRMYEGMHPLDIWAVDELESVFRDQPEEVILKIIEKCEMTEDYEACAIMRKLLQ